MGIATRPLTLSSLMLSLLAGSLSSCQTSLKARGVPATVERVVSGQTIEVLIPSLDARQQQRIRLAGLTSPDLKQTPWGPDAKATLIDLLQLTGDGRNRPTVKLDLLDTKSDHYQRRWAYVWVEGKLLNELVIQQGYGLLESRSTSEAITTNKPYQQRLRQAQAYARIMGYGIWEPSNPMRLTPQQFRSQSSTTP